jgi:hypothetical protein
VDRIDVWIKWATGTISFPGGICVACGSTEKVTAWLSKDARNLGLQTSATVGPFNFSLCEACAASQKDRDRKKGIEDSVKLKLEWPRWGQKKILFSFANPAYGRYFQVFNAPLMIAS